MIIVLTGATGLIGHALGQRLVREGHQLRALVRDPQRAFMPFPAELFSWDIRKPAPAEAFKGADAVIHLAGENVAAKRWTEARKKALRDSRIQGVESLRQGLELSRNSRPQSEKEKLVFISASGAGFYGDRGDEWLGEDAAPGDDFLARLCQEWEAAALAVPARRTVIARFGVVLSLRGGFLRELAPMFQRFGAARLGSGGAWLSWIHIDDVVAALMLALTDSELSGAVNFCAPKPATNSEVTAALKRSLGAFPVPPAPRLGIRLLLGELSQALLGSQRTRPERLTARGFRWRHSDFSSAIQELYGEIKSGETRLVFEQWVAAPATEVWPFFSSERNLERLTPAFLSFHVLGKTTEQMGEGTNIDYRLKVHGIPIRWRSVIRDWNPPHAFVDEQVSGPYRKWHHRHEFETLAGGTLLRDTVVLKPPLGWLGRAATLGFILQDVEAIFAFRAQAIRAIFSRPSQETSPR